MMNEQVVYIVMDSDVYVLGGEPFIVGVFRNREDAEKHVGKHCWIVEEKVQ